MEIADEAGAVAIGAVGGEHGLKPAWSEDQVVVEQGEKLTAGNGGTGVVGGGVAEVFALEDDTDRGIGREGGEPRTSVIGTAVVDENDLVGESGGERRAQRGEHRLREGEAVVERDEKRDRHVAKSCGARVAA